jgi:hypothetical protein
MSIFQPVSEQFFAYFQKLSANPNIEYFIQGTHPLPSDSIATIH